MPKQSILCSLGVFALLSGCSHPNSEIPQTAEGVLTDCWNATKINPDTFYLSTQVVNLGEQGWRAGTENCGGLGLQIVPESTALDQMYKIQLENRSEDQLGQFVFDISFDAKIEKECNRGLKLEAVEVQSLRINREVEACEIFEKASGRPICVKEGAAK